MLYQGSSRLETFYPICGAACLIVALVGILGAIFASILASLVIFSFVFIPLVVGLVGTGVAPSVKAFQLITIFGALAAIALVLSIFVHDIGSGISGRPFIRDPWSWFYLLPNVALLVLTIIRSKQTALIQE